MALARGDARNTHMFPTSLPVGNLDKAAFPWAKFEIKASGLPLAGAYGFFNASNNPSVLINTGHNANTRICLGPNSLASD